MKERLGGRQNRIRSLKFNWRWCVSSDRLLLVVCRWRTNQPEEITSVEDRDDGRAGEQRANDWGVGERGETTSREVVQRLTRWESRFPLAASHYQQRSLNEPQLVWLSVQKLYWTISYPFSTLCEWGVIASFVKLFLYLSNLWSVILLFLYAINQTPTSVTCRHELLNLNITHVNLLHFTRQYTNIIQ